MKKFRNIIIGLVILIVIILLILIILLKEKNKYDVEIDDSNLLTNGDTGETFEISNEEVEVTEISKFKTVENCIQQYYDAINTESDIYFTRNEDEELEKISDKEINQNILYYLSEEYIQENNITTSNLDEYISKVNEKVMVVSLNIKEIVNNPIEKFATYGIIMNLDYEILDTFCVYTNLDTENKTFSVEPINEEITNFGDVKIKNNNISIEENDYNTYEYSVMSYEDTAKEYMGRFKKITLANTNISYKYLNEEYRDKKFENVNEYNQYIQNNNERIEQANLSKYKVNYEDDYLEFVCIDQNGYYYIFKQYSPLNYDVILDTYTIDSNEFIEKYNSVEDKVKVAMNINKIVTALNDKDYNYIYNKLDETFKNNNFSTSNKLEEYLNNNLFEENDVEYNEFEEKGNNIYTYKIQISNSDNEDETRNMTIVMKLGEDIDFTMSFSFE